MIEKERIKAILETLKTAYPDAKTALKHCDPFELLVATILSAQCTDRRVNMITPGLFKKYPGPDAFAAADLSELEREIHSTGFYKNKALSIKESSKAVMERFGGRVPGNMDDLLTLRGVARKTANVVLGSGFGTAAGVVVDTHVKRVAFRLGLTKETDPVKIEKNLMARMEKKDWIWSAHALIMHGRTVCRASNPGCPNCALNKFCPRNGVTRFQEK